MDRETEERFQRIEKILEEHAQINKETALLARENQKRLDLLLADTHETREKLDKVADKFDQFLENQKEVA